MLPMGNGIWDDRPIPAFDAVVRLCGRAGNRFDGIERGNVSYGLVLEMHLWRGNAPYALTDPRNQLISQKNGAPSERTILP
jgi:hypothetical protein